MLYVLLIGLLFPFLGFLSLIATSHRVSHSKAALIACSTVFISFLCFTSLLLVYWEENLTAQSFLLFHWISLPEVQASFKLHIDALSLLMTLIITGVGFLIHVYSIGYMDHEDDFARYFACLNFFIFAMLLLVLAGDLLLLFVGWEGVGLASYLLIGFWYHRQKAAQAATKAFVINRIGDLGFLLGLLLIFHLFGTTDIVEIKQKITQGFSVGNSTITILTLFLFIGAIGKSAQLPLYNWLPDAMEGPTPVSALIHAATMVTAGVYLIVRLNEVFMLAPTTLQVIAVVGIATSLFAAFCATAQTDLKRVLAYSTVSQLGLMFLACGVGAFYAAMFHLTTHAFVKALLFLSAGNVVHMLHGTTEMYQMGGLSKQLPKTSGLFLIGVLAMAGIPPLAAFFSKEMLLEEVNLAGFHLLFYLGLVVSVLTAFYLTRAYFLTFRGQSQVNYHVQEAPHVMIFPLMVLAILAIGGGLLGFSWREVPLLERFLAKVKIASSDPHLSNHFIFTRQTLIAVLGAVLGVALAAYLYTKKKDIVYKPLQLFQRAFFVEDFYRLSIIAPLTWIGRWVSEKFETQIFIGSIYGVAKGIQRTASLLQHVQSGQIRSYVAWMTLGFIALIVYFTF